jgi:mannosylfructose-phosphate synthase
MTNLHWKFKTAPDVTPPVFTGKTSRVSGRVPVANHWIGTMPSPGRIAMVSTHGYVAANPPLGAADTGGQVVYVLELSKKLAQLGYHLDIWTRRFDNQPETEFVAERVRIVRVPCGGRDFIPKEYLYEKLPEWNENALRFIEKHDLTYEFIDSHYWDAGLAAQHLCDTLGVLHVHTPHSLGIWKRRQVQADYPGETVALEKEYNFATREYYERQIYERADVVVPTTTSQMELLLQDYGVPPEKCRTLPPGYDEERFFPVSESRRQAIRQRLGFSGPVVMAIGRLAQNKGYDLLIQAFQGVARRHPRATLFLAVGGTSATPIESELLNDLKEQVSQLGLVDRVRFGSFIPDEELADYYRAADVFAVSSRYEPFGMTAIEAMACGTPTVLTIHGGLCSAVTFGREAICADPLDSEEFGIMIHKAMADSGLSSRLSRWGARKVRRLFTWASIAPRLVELAEEGSGERKLARQTAGFAIG